MKSLLYKEFRLCMAPQTFVFGVMTALIIIPSWPSLVPFIYMFMGIMAMYPVSVSNRDLEYTTLLPVSKKKLVGGKVLFAVLYELTAIAISIPFAIAKKLFPAPDAEVYSELGINLVTYAVVLVMSGIYNLMFISWFYKNPHKSNKAQISSSLIVSAIMMVFMGIFMALPDVCVLVNTFHGTGLIIQIVSLVVGLAVFASFSLLAVRIGGRRLERIDL